MEDLFLNILNALQYGLLLLDDKGSIKYCNRTAREIISLSNTPPWPSFDEIGELYPQSFWKQPLQTADVMITIGKERMELLASTYKIPQGIILCLDREKSQIEDEFRFFIMDNMSEGVVLLDYFGNVLYMNSAAKVMLGVGLHAGSTKLWSIENVGEFLPKDFWRESLYKKEILFRKGDNEVHLLASAYSQSDKIILCLEEEKRETLRFMRQEALMTTDLDALVGVNPEFRKQAMVLANSDLSFLITGESGTGKEVMARAIHYSSSRSKGPFIVIDCTALPEHLVESELFGYEPGSFTGARSDGRAGKFELADGGTIMLDEISELPLTMQPKLLRILNDQLVMRIGARRPKAVNVRVIACTNRNLQEMVEKGHFRGDLFYRLKGAILYLEPLRERMEYFNDLVAFFIKKYGHGKKFQFSQAAQVIMHNFRWPGNVRELEKTIQYVLAQDPEETIKETLLPEDVIHVKTEMRIGKLKEMVKMHERMLVIEALQSNGYNITLTAKKMGLSRMGLSKKISILNIAHPHSKIAKRFPKRMARGNKAHIEVLDIPYTKVKAGDKIKIKLRITNTGRTPWLTICKSHRPTIKHAGQYYVQVEWIDVEKLKAIDSYSAILPKTVDCNETVIIDDYTYVTKYPGKYRVAFSMIQQGAYQFLDKALPSTAYTIKNCPGVDITVVN
jgi:transcriptional regulator with PAS, ATPase and Fis domain